MPNNENDEIIQTARKLQLDREVHQCKERLIEVMMEYSPEVFEKSVIIVLRQVEHGLRQAYAPKNKIVPS